MQLATWRTRSTLTLVVVMLGWVPTSAAGQGGQAFRASVGSGTHYHTASCGAAPDRPWVTWPTLTMIHNSTPLWSSTEVPKLTLIRVDGQWLPETVTAQRVTSTGIGQSTYMSTVTTAGIVTTTEVGSFVQSGVTASVRSTETLNLNTGEYQWCREISWPPFAPDNQYRRGTLPVTLTPTVLTADLAIVNFAAPNGLQKGEHAVPSVAQVRNVGQEVTRATTLEVELQDPTTGSWLILGSRAVPSLPPGQQEALPANADVLTVPDHLAISIYKQAESGEQGTYVLRACIRPVSGETNTGNNCTATSTRDVTVNSACHVAALDPIPDDEPLALELERARQSAGAPTWSLNPPYVSSALSAAVDAFVSAANFFCTTGAGCVRKSSGLRPVAYTRHLWAGNMALTAVLRNPTPDCADFESALTKHFEGEHDIKTNPLATVLEMDPQKRRNRLKLNPPNTTAHEYGLAVDVGGLKGTSLTPAAIDELAESVGLARPCGGDPVHFSELRSTTGGSTAGCKVFWTDIHSPVNVLVTDPLGRRVGFDPVTGAPINEIGPTVFYSGKDVEPETIAIGPALAGTYTVQGIGTGVGSYTLVTSVGELEGDVIEASATSGETAPGQLIAPVVNVVPQDQAPLQIVLNATSFGAGQTMTVSATLAPLAAQSVDAYIVLQLPTGQFLSLQLGGSMVPGIVPIARNFVPFAFAGTLLNYTFSGGEPTGTYTWYVALTEPGTLTFVSPLQQTAFSVP